MREGSKRSTPGGGSARPASPSAAAGRPPGPATPLGDVRASGTDMATAASGKSGSQPQVQIGNYRILDKIGTGGMGTVYRAVHVELDREVAIKILSSEMNSNPIMVARFKREAKAAAILQHENIVQIYDVSEDKGRHFLALEYVRGVDLDDLITKHKRLPLKRAVDFLKQAACALDHAFQKGIVHRDIKPSNFIITTDAKVKLCDMGLALRLDEMESKVTRHGTTVGTVDYMAPEQARDSRLADTRSDIYSLGCTFYQMLTGRVPFEQGSIPEKLFKHTHEPVPDPLQFNPDIPSAVLYVLNRMLEKKPEDRYQTPRELLADLDQIELDAAKPKDALRQTLAIGAEADHSDTTPELQRRGGPTEKKRVEEEARRRAQQRQKMNWAIIAAVAAVTLLAVGLTWWFLRGDTKPPAEVAAAPQSEPPLPGEPSSLPPKPAPVTPDDSKLNPPAEPAGPPGKKPGEPEPATQPSPEMPPGATPDAVPAVPDRPDPVAKPGAPPSRTPRLTDDERRQLQEKYFPDWPPVPIETAPVPVARGVTETGVLQSIGAACQRARSSSSKIEIEDNGPLFEGSFVVTNATLDIRPKMNERLQYPMRPLVSYDVRGDRLNVRQFFIQAQKTNLYIEGLDFVVNADDLAANLGTKPFYFFDIQGGDLTLKNCTFTIVGKHRGPVSLVRLSGLREPDPSRTPERLSRLQIEKCFVRGEPLTAVSLECSLADVKIKDSLLVGGQTGPLVEILPPTEMAPRPQRTLRFISSTFVTRGDFLHMDGTGEVPTEFIVFDTIVASASPDGGRKMIKTRSWLEPNGTLGHAKLDERGSLYTGWQGLLSSGLGGSLAASSAEEWQKVWKLENASTCVRAEPWPSEDLGDLAAVACASFAPTAVAADVPSTLSAPVIGCAVDRLPAPLPLVASRGCRPIDPPELRLDTLLPSHTLNPQKNPLLGRWQSEQNRRRQQKKPGDEPDPVLELKFDADKQGDLGTFLASQDLPETTTVVVIGSGTRAMSPIRLAGRSLVLWFQPTAGREPLRLTPLPTADPAEAMIELADGDLIIEGASFVYPTNAPSGVPARFIKVDRGNLTLARCRFYGPVEGDTGFEAIAFAGGPQRAKWSNQPAVAADAKTQIRPEDLHLDFHPAPHERVNACQLVDCYLGADSRCISFVASQGVLRLVNCLAVTPGNFLSVEFDPGVPDAFEAQLLLDHNTLAVSKNFVEVSDWIVAALPPRPFAISTKDNLFCDPFARTRGSTLLRYDARTLQQGILHWQSDHDGFTQDIDSFVLTKRETTRLRQKFDQDWLAVWGRPMITDPLVDARGDKIRLKGKELKVREFEQRYDFSLLALGQCEATSKASDGTALGADVTRIMP